MSAPEIAQRERDAPPHYTDSSLTRTDSIRQTSRLRYRKKMSRTCTTAPSRLVISAVADFGVQRTGRRP